MGKHFDSHHNWLLSQFLTIAPYQFADEIAAEITGNDFMIPAANS